MLIFTCAKGVKGNLC